MSGIATSVYDDMESEAAQIQVREGNGYNLYYYISDAYDSEGHAVTGWADANGDLAEDGINIGKGFWFKVPAAAINGTASLTLNGQVSSNASGVVSFAANTFVLAANPFPVASDLSSVTVSGLTAVGYDDMETDAAQIQVRNASGTGYNTFYYISDAYSGNDEVTGWADGAGDLAEGDSISVGAGFWVKSPTAGSITFSL